MSVNGQTRIFWLAGGLVAFGLGLIGAVLPLLPTTPFVLLAAYCFARSSPRLQLWLESHRAFGPMIANWRLHGAISVRAKIYSLGMMAASPVATWALDPPMWALIAQIATLMGAATFVATRPSGG